MHMSSFLVGPCGARASYFLVRVDFQVPDKGQLPPGLTSLAHSNLKPKDNAFPIGFGNHVSNHYEAIKLFREAGNVKLVLSGHTHMQDRVDYAGTSYICAGAVCGGWWNGPNQGFGPAFPIIDLKEDGTFSTQYINWENPD